MRFAIRRTRSSSALRTAHGRVEGAADHCAHPGCYGPGEFRAPDPYGARGGFDGPGAYRWLCFDHVREFNNSYNFFDGMSQDEIVEAQTPYSGWERETRAFTHVGADVPPTWRNFHDPLDAISARFRERMAGAKPDARPFSAEDRRALKVLKLDDSIDRRALRTRYTELVRKFHPDHNGGDRSYEKALQAVVEAYGVLRGSAAFA